MRRFLVILLSGLFCFVAGLCVGIGLAPQLKMTQSAQAIVSIASKAPWAQSFVQPDESSPFEKYEYPTIKWRAKPLADTPGAIGQLGTTYESGKMKYKLTVFKAPERRQCKVELLDNQGFKLSQFDVSDFHRVPGTSEIMEARDSYPCTEEEYKRVADYAID